ncbi:MAG TPA: DUF1552 domain-containing protein [Polyangiaceae bacterium]|nr:DUF1552 domain-containing protein [Polyangiaceae bacterium]
MNRRIFLRGVGGFTLAAPFLGSLNEAKGQAAADPRRLVIFYTHNGCLTDKWFPQVQNGPLTAADLTETLKPLAPYAGKLLLPRGFRSMNAYAQGQTIDPHDQACGSKLTCAPISTASTRYAMAESLDHTIAKQINPNKNTPLVLSVGAASTKVKEVISFQGSEMPFPSNVNPQTVFNALTLGTGATPTPTDPGPGMSPEVDYHVKRGQSAIDLVRGDLSRLQKLKMSTVDKGRLQNWLDLLRDTEVGVGGMTGDPMGGPTGMPAACNADTATKLGVTAEALKAASPTGKITGGTTSFGAPPPPGNNEGDNNLKISFTQGGDMMMNLIALNMICDANRVFVFLYPGYVVYNWDGMAFQNDHHGLSHRTGDNSVGGNCGVDGVLDKIQSIDNWLAGKFAKLVGLLDSIQEGTGTLLDSSATMWLSELSDGAAHNINNLPILIAGGAGGYLKQGAAVNVENPSKNIDNGKSTSTCQNGGSIGNTGSTGGNVPINKLYVTLMNAVGCTDGGNKVTKFGVMDGTNANPGISNPGEVSTLTSAG